MVGIFLFGIEMRVINSNVGRKFDMEYMIFSWVLVFEFFCCKIEGKGEFCIEV